MKNVKTAYQRLANQPLEQYKVLKPFNQVSSQAYILLIVFGVVTIWFLLSVLNLMDIAEEYRLGVIPYGISVVVLLLGPLVYIGFFSRKTIVLTDQALFKQKYLNKYIAIPFEDIQMVATDHENKLLMTTSQEKVKVLLKRYSKELRVILDILTFRGFFGEEAKPYEIVFEEGQMIVKEMIEAMDEDTSMLFEKYIQKYTYLTPGFLEDIIFYDTQIERIQLTLGKHVIVYLSHLDIKPTHPENTRFKAQKTDDAIVIFENVENIKITLLSDDEENKHVGKTIQALRDVTKKAIVFDAVLRDRKGLKVIDFTMSQEVKRHRVSFSYSEVIVGWNKFIANSWFEKP